MERGVLIAPLHPSREGEPMAPIQKTIKGPEAPRMPETAPAHIPPGKLPMSGAGLSQGGGGTTASPPISDGSTKKVQKG